MSVLSRLLISLLGAALVGFAGLGVWATGLLFGVHLTFLQVAVILGWMGTYLIIQYLLGSAGSDEDANNPVTLRRNTGTRR